MLTVTGQRTSAKASGGLWGVVTLVVSGFLGGAAAAAYALLNLGPGGIAYFYLSPAPLLVVAAAYVGGVVAGWFLAFLILSWAPGQFRCPRCGTANKRDARRCDGCELWFTQDGARTRCLTLPSRD